MKNAPKDQNNLKDNLLHGKQRQVEYLFMETTLSSHTKLQMSTHTLTDVCLLPFRSAWIPSTPRNTSVFIFDWSQILLFIVYVWPTVEL